MSSGGNYFINSGVKGATFGAMGFFSAGVLPLGTAVTVSALGTAAAAGFVGGLALYAPAVALRLAMHHFGYFNAQSRYLVAAVDLALLALTLPVGAWVLGLAVQPFFIAAVVAVTLYTLLNALQVVAEVVKHKRNPQQLDLPRAFEESFTGARYTGFDETTATLGIGSFC